MNYDEMFEQLMTNYHEMYHEEGEYYNPEWYEEQLNNMDDDQLTEEYNNYYGDN